MFSLSNPSYTRQARLAVIFVSSLFGGSFSSSTAQAVTITSPTHPVAVFHDFSAPTVPFTAYTPPGGVPSGARFEIENGALKMTNAHAGSFGVDTKIKQFDADKFSDVFFDYQLSPQVKVNVFFRIKGKYHGAIFSGPAQVRPGSVLLGKIAGVQADGKWHRAHIPLRDWLRTIYPLDGPILVDEIIIGNWDNSGWLMAGMGGNGPGVRWHLDNLAIVGAGPEEGTFNINDDAGQPLSDTGSYTYSLDGKPTPLPGKSIKVAARGFAVLRITDNKSKTVATAPLLATSAPRAGEASLRNNEVVVSINAPAGLDNRELKLTIGDRAFDHTSPFLLWDGARSTLVLDAARAGFTWSDGQNFEVAVSGIKDTIGRTATDVKRKLTVRYAQHTATAPRPQVPVLTSEISGGTFEDGIEDWSPRDDGGAILERDDKIAASGRYSLRLTSPGNAAPLGAWIRRTTFDAVKYPIISFNYRIPPDLRADFVLTSENMPYSIQFTDRDNPRTRIGTIADVKADNQWHRAEINLLDWLRAVRPDLPTYRVESLALMDEKWLGNARGVQYWIDDFQFVPRLPGKPFRAEVQLQDITGLQAISWIMDDRPTTVPPSTAAAGKSIEFSGSGRKWLHVRAQNGAGHWGPAAHFPILLDDTAP